MRGSIRSFLYQWLIWQTLINVSIYRLLTYFLDQLNWRVLAFGQNLSEFLLSLIQFLLDVDFIFIYFDSHHFLQVAFVCETLDRTFFADI